MRFVLLLCVAGVLGACDSDDAAAPTTPPRTALEANAVVDRIVDGDTVDVIIDGTEDRVRLIGIDTPEIAHASSGDRPGNDAECFADDAHEFTRSLIDVGTPVRLERDTVGRDDYGRLLAYVYRADDGVFVNYELVRQGYATPLSIAPNTTFADLMVDAARRAEQDGAGLWSACAAPSGR
ncbi:MAG: thermonuclease family protein [Ilumatobacter sp.]|nr:thermonuclease family protein [Ilumatobacter sp.]